MVGGYIYATRTSCLDAITTGEQHLRKGYLYTRIPIKGFTEQPNIKQPRSRSIVYLFKLAVAAALR